jgi:hypothetical protein
VLQSSRASRLAATTARSTLRTRIGVMPAVVVVLVMAAFFLSAPPALASFGSEGFGIEKFEAPITTAGLPPTQAGSHPDSMTASIVFNHHCAAGDTCTEQPGQLGNGYIPDGNPENIELNLPPGFLINPTATDVHCTEAELPVGECPAGSVVGSVTAHSTSLPDIEAHPIYDMAPPPTVPADFAADIQGLIVHIVGKVRTGSDYGFSAEVPGISQHGGLFGATFTFNGFPDGKPLFTMPTACGSPLTTTLSAHSWQLEFAEALPFVNHDSEGSPVPVTGCEHLSFDPTLKVRPSTTATDSPSGLSIEINVPREEESAGSLAQADLKDAVVTLPAGISVSASAANGLGACTPQQIGLTSPAPAACPDASKVGAVEVTTPLLEAPLQGSLYLAQQGNAGSARGENPYGSLLALYLVAEGSGVVLKIPGVVRLDPTTGQLTAHFGEDPLTRQFMPQLSFSHLALDFFGGSTALLSTPSQCGTYTVTSQMTPWSAPQSGPPATPSSSFEINENCHGPEFHPSFTAGMEDNHAGAFSPFSLTLGREDGEEDLSRVQVQLPPGLSGEIASVPLCQEPQAQAGTCPQASLIGHVILGAGTGPDPVYIPGAGKPQGLVYLTGPTLLEGSTPPAEGLDHSSAPFGLSIVVAPEAGPLDLGPPVVVRAAVNVDPQTAALTITFGPLPRILEGIPLDLRTVHVSLDRKGFLVNPTNCEPLAVNATIASTVGAGVAPSSRFQAADCGSLPFSPKLTALTRANGEFQGHGASLHVAIASAVGQANMRSLKLDLPQRLPARLETIQHACPETTFDANPAACPKASVIGSASVQTPILGTLMAGPALLVSKDGASTSHPGESKTEKEEAAFPNLVLVLQGEGVRIDLTGGLFVSEKNITSVVFRSIPDVPIRRLDLVLPEGNSSILAASSSLCTKKPLTMFTAIGGQNGARVKPSVKVGVAGCKGKPGKKRHAAKRAQSARH